MTGAPAAGKTARAQDRKDASMTDASQALYIKPYTASELERMLGLKKGTVREGAAQGLWDAHYPPGHKRPKYFLDEVLHGLGHAGNLASAAGR